MKKFGLLILTLLISCLLAVGAFSLPTIKTVAADEVQSGQTTEGTEEGEEEEEKTPFIVPEAIFEYFHIYQGGDVVSNEGYEFGPEDFVESNAIDKVSATIFTNKTITIYFDDTGLSPATGDKYSVYADDERIVFENTIVDEESQHLYKYNDKYYFVFDVSTLEEDTATRIHLSMTRRGVVTDFTFALVQTVINLHKTGVLWEYTPSSLIPQTITAPTGGLTYPPLTLHLPYSSKLNPVSVRFTYCGEVFEFYQIGDKLYTLAEDEETEEPTTPSQGSGSGTGTGTTRPNTGSGSGTGTGTTRPNTGSGSGTGTGTNTEEETKPLKPKTEENGVLLEFQNMIFDVSGTYKVEIFDQTYNDNYASNNYLVYTFNIENSEHEIDRFYFNAHLEDGQIIMNRQITNEKTIVEFVNINKGMVRNQIERIVVERIVRTSTGNVPYETTYTGRQIDDLIENEDSTLVFEEDGTYTISVYTLSNAAPKTFQFRLLKNIGNQFNIDGVDYVVSEDAVDNETTKIDITRSVETTYGSSRSPLSSKTTYSFFIVVARSVVRIDGVNDKSRVSGNIILQVAGVGKLTVTITQDGKTTTKEFNIEEDNRGNVHTLQTLSVPGHYVVSVTDEMGNTLTKSFTIRVKMNAAAIILLAVAGVVALLVIVFIIFARARVKVR